MSQCAASINPRLWLQFFDITYVFPYLFSAKETGKTKLTLKE
jgi:hypothetical protein